MQQIQSAIISVYYKDGLEEIIKELAKNNVEIYSTGGTATFIESLGIVCKKVEDVTTYPEILGGRVKTLHPGVFGGLLARRDNQEDTTQMSTHHLPYYDLMICNLYPFEEYVAKGSDAAEIIEKIDIGGVSLIRAAAKNFNDVVCISNPEDYKPLLALLKSQAGATNIAQRRQFASNAFKTVAQYDQAISDYFLNTTAEKALRYGENPHQKGAFKGDLDAVFEQLNGKELSYNNLLDVDAAVSLIQEFTEPTFAIIKHNNSCGLASRDTILQAYQDALACDPTSAFGGVLISNRAIDLKTAEQIHSLFFEILIAPSFDEEAKEVLCFKKKNRILLKQKQAVNKSQKIRNILNGTLVQDNDLSIEDRNSWQLVTEKAPSLDQIKDLEFGIKAVKHLKSNAIALVKNQQLIGMGCGQTSRIDSLKHAIQKAKNEGFNLRGAIMASDAFFPFEDCVAVSFECGIDAVAQPGGSINDQKSIDECNKNNMSMVMTGIRHFNH